MDSLFALEYIIVRNRFEASLIAITYANDGEEIFRAIFYLICLISKSILWISRLDENYEKTF